MKITAVHFVTTKHIKLTHSPHMAQTLQSDKWSFEMHGDWVVGRWAETGERLAWPGSSISHLEVVPLALPDLEPAHSDIKALPAKQKQHGRGAAK
jgi:hypothetical protein